MAGRIAWIMAGGAAILAGMAFQGDIDIDGPDHRDVSVHVAEGVERRTAAVIDRIAANPDQRIIFANDEGKRIDLDPQTRQQLASAVGALLKSEARLALLDFKNEDDGPEADRVRAERDRAQGEIDAIEARVEAQTGAVADDSRRTRDEMREDVRTAVREQVEAARR